MAEAETQSIGPQIGDLRKGGFNESAGSSQTDPVLKVERPPPPPPSKSK